MLRSIMTQLNISFFVVMLAMILISAVMLSSCGAQIKDSDISPDVGEPVEVKNLTLWFYFEGKERFDKIKAITDGFTRENPDIVIQPVFVPFNDLNKRLSIGLAGADTPDLVFIDSPNHAAYAAMGLFADITDLLEHWPDKEQYYPAPWGSVFYEGKQYGVPLGMNSLAMFYNKKMFEEADAAPPATWDELRLVAQELTKNGVTGLGISAPGNDEATFQYFPWLYSAGGDIRMIGGSEGVHSLTFLADMVSNGFMSKEVINWTQSDVMKQFASGKIAMMTNGPWQIPELASLAPDLEYGIIPIPIEKEHASVIGGENIGVVNGPHVAEAIRFIKYAASPAVAKEFSQGFGYFPARRDVASDPYWSNDPRLQVFLESFEYAKVRGPHPKWPAISSVISAALDQVLSLQSLPDVAAKEAQFKIDKIME